MGGLAFFSRPFTRPSYPLWTRSFGIFALSKPLNFIVLSRCSVGTHETSTITRIVLHRVLHFSGRCIYRSFAVQRQSDGVWPETSSSLTVFSLCFTLHQVCSRKGRQRSAWSRDCLSGPSGFRAHVYPSGSPQLSWPLLTWVWTQHTGTHILFTPPLLCKWLFTCQHFLQLLFPFGCLFTHQPSVSFWKSRLHWHCVN